MTHTPGPWKVANGQLWAQWSVPGQWHGLPCSEENLRLQAAAPDLLAALKVLYWHADPKTEDGREARKFAVKAIAKAGLTPGMSLQRLVKGGA